MGCLDEDAVLQFVGGSLGASDRALVDQHIAGCDSCRALVADAARFLLAPETPPPAAASTARRPRRPIGWSLALLIGAAIAALIALLVDPWWRR
jgi:hypothetical protein